MKLINKIYRVKIESEREREREREREIKQSKYFPLFLSE
jgi:hypothetical protein